MNKSENNANTPMTKTYFEKPRHSLYSFVSSAKAAPSKTPNVKYISATKTQHLQK